MCILDRVTLARVCRDIPDDRAFALNSRAVCCYFLAGRPSKHAMVEDWDVCQGCAGCLQGLAGHWSDYSQYGVRGYAFSKCRKGQREFPKATRKGHNGLVSVSG